MMHQSTPTSEGTVASGVPLKGPSGSSQALSSNHKSLPQEGVTKFKDMIAGERLTLKEAASWRALLSDFSSSTKALQSLLESTPPYFEASAVTPSSVPMDLTLAANLPNALSLLADPTMTAQHQALFAAYACNDNWSLQQLIQQEYIQEGGKVCASVDAIESLVESDSVARRIQGLPGLPPVTLTMDTYKEKRAAFAKMNEFIDKSMKPSLRRQLEHPERYLDPEEDLRTPFPRGVYPHGTNNTTNREVLYWTNNWRSVVEMEEEKEANYASLLRDLRTIYGGSTARGSVSPGAE